MKLLHVAATIVVLAFAVSPGLARDPKGDPLSAVAPLVGEWAGVGEGQPGISAAVRHAKRVQDKRYIMVEGRSVYPKQEKNKSGEVHTSIDLWSYDTQRKLIVMRQFDNLGFVSTYVQDRAASTGGRIVLVSEHLENVPAGWKARYTYAFPAPNEYHEIFELATNDEGFKPYVSGKYLRVEP